MHCVKQLGIKSFTLQSLMSDNNSPGYEEAAIQLENSRGMLRGRERSYF